MTVVTRPPDSITLLAETQDELELLESIVVAIRDGGTVEVHGVAALEFDGDQAVKKSRPKRREPKEKRR